MKTQWSQTYGIQQKAVLNEKFIAIQFYLKKQETSNKNLSVHAPKWVCKRPLLKIPVPHHSSPSASLGLALLSFDVFFLVFLL